MPAYFENGVFTDNQPAWHGLGVVTAQQYLTMDEVFAAVPELASEVRMADVMASLVTDDGKVLIADTDRFYAVMRLCDAKMLGCGMSSGYGIPQPRELFEFVETIVEQGGCWKTAGTLNEGSTVWGMIEIPDSAKIAGETYQRNLYVATSYDRSMGTRVGTNSTRIVCANTLAAADRETQRSFSVRHTANWRDRLHDAKAALRLAYDHHEHLRVLGEQLAAVKVKKTPVRDLIARLVPYTPESEVSDIIKRNLDAKRFDIGEVVWRSPNLENLRGTAWGVVQGVTEWEQHYANVNREGTAKLRQMLDNDLPLTKQTLAWARDLAGIS